MASMKLVIGQTRGQSGPRTASPGCGHECGHWCGSHVHTPTAARPRQHWVFESRKRPTTRPPHRTADWLVRVVGLFLFSFQMLAGAGTSGWVVQRLVWMKTSGEGGEAEEAQT